MQTGDFGVNLAALQRDFNPYEKAGLPPLSVFLDWKDPPEEEIPPSSSPEGNSSVESSSIDNRNEEQEVVILETKKNPYSPHLIGSVALLYRHAVISEKGTRLEEPCLGFALPFPQTDGQAKLYKRVALYFENRGKENVRVTMIAGNQDSRIRLLFRHSLRSQNIEDQDRCEFGLGVSGRHRVEIYRKQAAENSRKRGVKASPLPVRHTLEIQIRSGSGTDFQHFFVKIWSFEDKKQAERYHLFDPCTQINV